ncbi:MAG: phosphomannomutase, partial [Nitrospira sp.]
MGLFREYDIRGIVGTELTEDLAEQIGRAYGTRAVRAGAQAVAVGRDGRTSARQMRAALLKGLLGCGLDVVDV